MRKQVVLGVLVSFLAVAAGAAEFVTNSAGGEGGGPFAMSCPSDMALVGIHGQSGVYIDRFGIMCVKVNSDGTWNGNPVKQEHIGGPGGSYYEIVCARNSAISGFQGRNSGFIDQLQFSCNPLTSQGKLTGNPNTVNPVIGGTGGNPFGPYYCQDWKPGKGLVGRYGAWMDKLALTCDYPTVPPPVTPPATPVLLTPANGTDIFHNQSFVFSWQASAGTSYYQLVITTASTVGSYAEIAGTQEGWGSLSNTSLTVPASQVNSAMYGKTLKWAVRACNSGGCSATSENRAVFIRFPPTDPINPAENVTLTNLRPTFTWAPVTGATGYRINLSTLTDPYGSFKTYDVTDGTAASYTPTSDIPISPANASGFYYSVKVCAPHFGYCGYAGTHTSTASSTANWVKYPSSGTTLTWTSPLTNANTGLTLGTHLLNKTLNDIVNSTPIPNSNPQAYTSGRTDGDLCTRCHTAAGTSGLANFYKPQANSNGVMLPITPTSWAFTGRPATWPNTYRWSYDEVPLPAAANWPPATNWWPPPWPQVPPTQASPVRNFCRTTTPQKPQDLCLVFLKWLSDGARYE